MGIETATPALGVALVDGSGVVAECSQRRDRAHAEQLLPLVRGLLSGAGRRPQEVEGLAVSAGPGSFTGLRIGLALAKGWAYAASIPLLRVPSLDALALLLGPAPAAARGPSLIAAVLDARRGQVYCGLYRWGAERVSPAGTASGEAGSPGRIAAATPAPAEGRPPAVAFARLGEYRCLEPEALLQGLPAEMEAAGAGEVWFVGDALGLPGFWDEARARLGPRARRAGTGREEARAWCVALLGREGLVAGRRDDPFSALPIYVSPPSARVPAKLPGEPRRPGGPSQSGRPGPRPGRGAAEGVRGR